MKIFLLKFLLYAGVFLLPFAVFAAWLIYTGETMPLAWVVHLQQGEAPVLYRPRYGNRDMAFKVLATNTRQPEVLALGSSRVLQLRQQLFTKKPSAFYNAGAPAWGLTHVDTFIQRMEANPKILILGLDQPWFNPNFVEDPLVPDVSDFDALMLTTRGIARDVLSGMFFDVALFSKRHEPSGDELALGWRAIGSGHGFRNDGSEQYGDFLVMHYLSPDIERARHMDWLRAGEQMYVRGDTLSEDRLAELDSILKLCKERGIFVIGFSPSFMPSLYAAMVSDGQHTYLPKLIPRLQQMFARYGFAYFDFSNGAWAQGKDTDFFDGWHASELVNLFMVIQMAQALPDQLGSYIDTNTLYAIASQATNTFDIYDHKF